MNELDPAIILQSKVRTIDNPLYWVSVRISSSSKRQVEQAICSNFTDSMLCNSVLVSKDQKDDIKIVTNKTSTGTIESSSIQEVRLTDSGQNQQTEPQPAV
jgi:hypothetical protein